jgi:hypothetical protein
MSELNGLLSLMDLTNATNCHGKQRYVIRYTLSPIEDIALEEI